MKFLSLLRSLLSVMFPCHSLRDMYERYRPDKLSEWSDLCYKYKGQEEHWLNAMHNKYLGAPLTPQEWEERLIQQPSEEIRAQRARRARSLFRGNHITSHDGESRPGGKRPRIDIQTRMLHGTFEFLPPASQPSGDLIADLLTAWHMVVKPLALERVPVNWKTGKPLGSIRNTNKFPQNNMGYVAKLYKVFFGLPEKEWFLLHNVNKMIRRLFHEACCGLRGKWKWENFSMEQWEIDMYSHIVLRAYVAGGGDSITPWFD